MRTFPILGLLALALAPTQASAATATPVQPQFHALANPGHAKSAAELKPKPSTPAAIPPIQVELRAHYHADGSVSHSCDGGHVLPAPAMTERTDEAQR